MKSFFFSALALLLVCSCSNDENNQQNQNTFDISGKLYAPNHTDPIVNAKVNALQNNVVISTSHTDAQGNYTIALPEGDFNLRLTKGLFSTQKEISVTEEATLENYSIETLPKIGVVKGNYDNIESILYSIGLVDPITQLPLFDIIDWEGTSRMNVESHHIHQNNKSIANRTNNPILDPNVEFSFTELLDAPTQLAIYDILFINCGITASNTDGGQNLMDYVNNGGFLYATDWASGTLATVTNNDADYISFLTPRKSGTSLSTTASISDPNLSAWLSLNFGISIDASVEIDEFLSSWQVVDSFDPATTISLLNGPVDYVNADNVIVSENKDLALTFQLGDGAVFYSSFHTENDELDFSPTDRIMEYMVFEMTDIED